MKYLARSTQLVMAVAIMLTLSHPALANPPTKPGQPFGVINGSTIKLDWLKSWDADGVAGYNVYRNNRYVATVSGTKYSGQVDASQVNTYYVVAFDNLGPSNRREFSKRSPVQTFGAVQPSSPAQVEPQPQPQPQPQQSLSSTPTAPQNLRFVHSSPSTLTMSWSASQDDKGVVGYNVYRNGRYVATVRTNNFRDTNLSAGTQYTYYVVAFDQPRNFSPKSAKTTTRTMTTQPVEQPPAQLPIAVVPNIGPDTERPAIVTGLQASKGSNGINVQWNTGQDNVAVVGYNLYRNKGYLATVFSTNYIDTTAPANTENTYAIAAFDKARNYGVTSDYVFVGGEQTPVALGTPPTLRDPLAEPIPSPLASDPFGSNLEIDTELAVIGGPPTQPKNLRAELVSNNWAEINWAPANDDGTVVEYRIYRSDGVIYSIRGDQSLSNAANQPELDRFWRSTLFIDCNFTRFNQQVHNCKENQPKPGDEFIYEVSAIDDEGLESARSQPLEIIYHLEQNAPIPFYNDFYKPHDDKFVQEHDLSRVSHFLDDFSMVFSDDFNGNQINDKYWNTELVWGDNQIINGEQQYFVNTQDETAITYSPFNLTGDTLKIESIPTPDAVTELLPSSCTEVDPFGKQRCAFLSGALSSHDKFGITYGYVESRMKVSGAFGSLSSFYLYNRYPGTGKNLHAPEIDIVEYLGENPFGDERAFQTYHYDNVNDGSTYSSPTMSYANPDGTRFDEDFHTFGVLWEPQLVIWYVDGVEIKRLSGPQVSRQRMNIVTYLVSGSAWAPTPDVNSGNFPMEFEIDYIKAYQRAPFATNGLYPD